MIVELYNIENKITVYMKIADFTEGINTGNLSLKNTMVKMFSEDEFINELSKEG